MCHNRKSCEQRKKHKFKQFIHRYIIIAYRSPNVGSLLLGYSVETKKTWENLSPLIQPTGLRIAIPKDKQLSQPTPTGIIKEI